MKGIFRKLAQILGYDLQRLNGLYNSVFTFESKAAFRGEVLVSYIIEPYLKENHGKTYNSHTHFWESGNIVEAFLEMGFSVDVIDYRNSTFLPKKDYSVFVGARTNFERISKILNGECLKIVHLDTSHWAFNNHASYARLLNLVNRKGFTVKGSLRLIEANFGIEYADYATVLGNEVTVATYQFAQKPMFKIPVSTCGVYPFDESKDFESCSRNYIWFGSAGAVHRGLDLLLEIFSGMPDFHLYICGPISTEKDFVSAYHREVFETKNIHFMGWQDVNSSQFEEICRKCVALVYPSCAEGQCGAVVNCMHIGLIPVVSAECGVDVSDFGVILKKCSIPEIESSIRTLSSLSPKVLKEMARKSWEYARSYHTRERFSQEYRKALSMIMVLSNQRSGGNFMFEGSKKGSR